MPTTQLSASSHGELPLPAGDPIPVSPVGHDGGKHGLAGGRCRAGTLGLELRCCALGTSTLGAIIRPITLVSTHGAGAIFAHGSTINTSVEETGSRGLDCMASASSRASPADPMMSLGSSSMCRNNPDASSINAKPSGACLVSHPAVTCRVLRGM
ncbi:MAG TPA: hypothetical protein VGH85_10530 [Mycobacteriales bacterium]